MCGTAALVLGSCCDDTTQPCTPWLREGETYRVELVSHFEVQNDNDPDLEVPYTGYEIDEETCGDALDLAVGSVVSMTAHEGTKRNQPEKCVGGGCFHRRATAQVDGVLVENDEPRLPHPVGSEEFYSRFVGSINGDCRITYDIGIAKIEQRYIERTEQPVPTDYMLFRSVVVDPASAEACRPFVASSSRNICWDSWYVHIRDAEDNLISTDLAGSGLGEAGS